MADVTLGETPDRIWAWSFCGLRKPNQVETVWVKKSRNIGTEYVRGDLHRSTVNQREKELADLRAEVERLRNAIAITRQKGVRIEREANAFQDVGASLEAKIRIKVCDEIAALAPIVGNPRQANPVACHETSAVTDNAVSAEAIRAEIAPLQDALDWMEETRASGDAGFWEWEPGDDYCRARDALARLTALLPPAQGETK